MKKVAVFTATRAEYGLLRPVLQHLTNSTCCIVQMVISGTHLSSKHGYTISEIADDTFSPAAVIPMDLSDDSDLHLCGALGKLITDVGQSLCALQPDILVLLGDRYECYGAAIAATMLHIPIAHIHGGEITQGAMDDAFRHAITKMSHLHFTSCDVYKQRVMQLGEQPERIWNVGALGVENALSLPLLSEEEIRFHCNIAATTPYFLCTFHPVTLELGAEEVQIQTLFEALDTFPDHAVIFTGANADPGGNGLNRLLHEYAAAQPERVKVYPSLGVLRYLSAAKYAACVVGNSSSGIIEIPSLGVPVVNIGNRQQGRIASAAVIHCAPESKAIVASIRSALTPQHRQIAKTTPNPYDKPGTSAAIAETLQNVPLAGILKKKFNDITFSAPHP